MAGHVLGHVEPANCEPVQDCCMIDPYNHPSLRQKQNTGADVCPMKLLSKVKHVQNSFVLVTIVNIGINTLNHTRVKLV